jgi:predicted metal-dependent HD superfamily phosphohydrolase
MVPPPVSALTGRFTALLSRLGATGDTTALATDLLAAWSAPDRAYHNRRHLEDCLAQLDRAKADPPTRDLVEAALWFHDAVYDPRAGDNEERSAAWAAEALPAAGVAPDVAGRIAGLVRLTAGHGPASDLAGQLVCDIDLSILGRPVELFDSYDRGIRAEYAWVPEPAYRAARARILEDLLRRDPLFQTPAFRRRFETRARANLQRALAGLGQPA